MPGLKVVLREAVRELRRLKSSKKSADLIAMEAAVARGLPVTTRPDFASALFFQSVREGGIKAAALLRLARIKSLDTLTNGQLRKLLDAATPIDLATAMAGAELALGPTTALVARQMLPYRKMRQALFYVNRTAALAAIGAAATVTEDLEKLREIASALAEVSLFEAAHFYDARLIDGAVDLRRIKADFAARLNWSTSSEMPTLGLPRAVHRSSLSRLGAAGIEIPAAEAENWSNVFAGRIRYATTAVADTERIVLHPGSRGWEAVRAFGEVCEDAFPGIWTVHRDTVFKHFDDLLMLLPAAERDVAARSWSAYRAARGL